MIQSIIYRIKKNSYLFFAVKALVLLLVIFILDRLAGRLLNHYYFKQTNGVAYRTTYAMEQTRADVLIFGSSRANHHYHPRIFKDLLKMSYFNAGRDGTYIFYHSGVLKSALKRYTPKIVVLDFMADEFNEGEQSYDRMAALLPYYSTHPEIRELLQLKSRFEKIKLLSASYPYNSLALTITGGNTGKTDEVTALTDGYVPLLRSWNMPPASAPKSSSAKPDSLKIKAYEGFIKDCKQSGAKLYIVCSPYFVKDFAPTNSFVTGKQIAIQNNVAFIDFSHNSFFADKPGYFSDPVHLNDSGAAVFSKMLIAEMNRVQPAK